MDEQTIFTQALEQPEGETRDRWLEDACGGDRQLRARVETLLRKHAQAGSFLETPPAEFQATVMQGTEGEAVDERFESTGQSVLDVLGQTIDVPHVVLRESEANPSDPIARPRSPEMPKADLRRRYQLQGEIARGGMGAIFKGRDNDLGRDLAIKVLLDEHTNKPEVIQRFIEEAQIGGQLQHPGIAPVYEFDLFPDQRPFFSMKLVKGFTLAKLLADRADATSDRGRFLGIFEQICQTMAYAHSRGVIHRDLKPANIMVGAFGEVQVMDWGLAKVLAIGGVADEQKPRDTQQQKSMIQTLRSMGSDAPGSLGSGGTQTQIGSVMGTPAYMPPEQALGEIDNLDERADVFGLGGILCEILTGKPPYVAEDSTRVYHLAARGKLADCFQRLDECGADSELIALAKQCLELEPSDRPRDAQVLAQGVTGYLKSVEERLRATELAKVEAETRADELRRRRKFWYAIAVLLMVGLVGVGCAAMHFRSLEETQRILADHNHKLARVSDTKRSEAEAAKEDFRRLLYNSDMDNAEQAWEDGNLFQVNRLLRRHVPAAGETDLRGFEWYALWRLVRPSVEAPTFELATKSNNYNLVAFMPGEEQVIGYLSPGGSGQIFDLATRSQRSLKERLGVAVRTVWYLDTATGFFATWNEDGTLSLWRAGENRVDKLADIPVVFESIGMISLSADQKTLALVSESGWIELWDVERGEQRGVLDLQGSEARRLSISPDGRHLVISDGSPHLQLWDLESSTMLNRLRHEGNNPRFVFSSDSQQLVTWTNRDRSELRLWSVETGEEVAELQGHTRKIHSAAFSFDGKTVGSTSLDGNVILWDVESQRARHVLGEHRGWPWAIAFGPESKRDWVATGGADNTVILWDVETGKVVDEYRGHPAWIRELAFSPSGTKLASVDGVRSVVKVWDLAKRSSPTQIQAHESSVDAIAISADGRLAATAGRARPRVVKVWDLASGKLLREFFGHNHLFPGNQVLAMSPDGRSVAIGLGATVQVWNVETGTEQGAYRLDETVRRFVFCVDWSPQGRYLAAGLTDGTVAVWDTATGEMRELPAGKRNVNAVRFSPDEQLLATGSSDEGLKVWDLESGSLRSEPELDSSGITSIAFSDSGQLAVSLKEGDILVFHVDEGREIGRLAGHAQRVFSVSYLPGNGGLISVGMDATIRRWDTSRGETGSGETDGVGTGGAAAGDMVEAHQFRGHTAAVLGLAVSADGRTIVTADDDGVLQIRRAASAERVETSGW